MQDTPAQTIKRIEQELRDEKLKTEVLNQVIDYSDQHLGTSLRKKSISQSSESFNKKRD